MRIPYCYYRMNIRGSEMDPKDFDSLSVAAEDLLAAAIGKELPECEETKRAVCYQTEMLYLQDGRRAVAARSATNGISQTLGDYAVGTRGTYKTFERIPTVGGVPVSALALYWLRRAGLTCRAVIRG